MTFNFLNFGLRNNGSGEDLSARITQESQLDDNSAPSRSNKIGGLVNSIWNGCVSLKQKAQEGYQFYIYTNSESIKKIVEATGKAVEISGKVAFQGIVCLDEFLDFANANGTKSPSASVDQSWQRLSQHNLPFANCVEFLANQAAQAYVDNEGTIKSKICTAISGYSLNKEIDEKDIYALYADAFNPVSIVTPTLFNGASSVTDWFLSLSTELISQTIKANIMHIAANLADEAYDDSYSFEDSQRNPLGRLLSVIGNCFTEYEERLADIAKLAEDEQNQAYLTVFEEISSDLLAKFFPKGEQDLQLFHHTIPFMKLIKGYVWEQINKDLPGLLMRLYQETRPVAEECEDWRDQFDAEGYGLKADQLVKLPSNLLQYFVSNHIQSLDSLTPVLEQSLQNKGMKTKDAKELSENLVKYAKEFLLTDDPALHKMGTFFEGYFMERILFNLAQYVPEDEIEDIPMPLYVLKQWIEGDVFNTLSKRLTGTTLAAQDKAKAVDQLLAPFGLNQKNSFPLPPIIKEMAWPAIQDLLADKAPAALFDIIPKWLALGERAFNQKRLNSWLDDESVTHTLSNVIGMGIDKAMQTIQSTPSIAKQINGMLLSPILSNDQQKEIDEQWMAFLKENQSFDILKEFSQHCLEALALQICKDLYKNYQKMVESAKEDDSTIDIQGLFNDDDLEFEDEETDIESPMPFAVWFFSEITQACESLAADNITNKEVKILQRAIELQNAIRDAQDPVQAKKDQDELNQLWPQIQPKFEYLLLHVLKIMNYGKAADLPLPKELQPMVWKILTDKLPLVLFEQIGNVMLPVLEKEKLQKEIKTLPEGKLIKQGCHLLAQDIVSHLPEWLDGKLDHLPEDIATKAPDIDLSDKAGDYLTEMLNAIVKVEDSAYQPVWQWVESYLEGLFLKIASKIGKMSQKDLQQLRSLAQQAKNELLALDEIEDIESIEDFEDIESVDDCESFEIIKDEAPKTAEDILANFTDQLLACLGVEASTDLFGIPQSLQDMLFKEIKTKMAQGLLGIYKLDQKIRNHVVVVNEGEEHLPTSKVAQAALALTRFALDKATDQLTQQVNGEVKVISQIYDPLNLWLEQQVENDYKIAALFQDMIAKEVPTSLLVNLFELLDASATQSYKQGLADWINPVLTDQVIQHLTPLLEKEQEGQAAFDQSVFMALLPILTRHLKHLNEASQAVGGLNYENFVEVAGDELHQALPLTEEDQEGAKIQKQDHFYKKQAELIFQLIFPNGKEDVAEILPDLDISDDQFKLVSKSVKDLVASQLPQAIEVLFEQEMLETIFTALFETIIDTLDEPIDMKSSPKKSLTKEEKAQQKAMDEQIGQLIIEAAKFIDLPVGVLDKLPGWAKRVTGVDGIGKSTYESIGASIRKQFNGELFAKTIESVLPKLAKQKHVKKTPQEKIDSKKQAKADLKELERKLAQKSVAYVFRYLGARIANATNIFTNPVLKFVRSAILSICSFVFVTLLGSTLRYLKIERFVVNRLHDLIQHASQKAQVVFAQPELHEDMVYQAVEAFEDVLMEKDIEIV